MQNPVVECFHHTGTGTCSYVVSDPQTGAAAIVDPVLEFSVVSGQSDTAPVQPLIDIVRERGLTLEWILETHAHADHLSSAQYVKAELGGQIAIGKGITDVQRDFGRIFNLKPPFAADGHQFDRLFDDGDEFALGQIGCRVIATPGHTNDSISYVVGDSVFIGDTMFMLDFGTARCDFPGGDAGLLYDSIQKLLALPPETALYLCHDYPPETREVAFKVTVAEQLEYNLHVGKGTGRDEFVAMRESRDATLPLPRLIIPSIQVNIQGGNLPDSEDNSVAYLKIPLDQF